MSEERGPRIERLLQRTARAISGGTLHPLEVLSEVERACLAGAEDGALPNHIRVTLPARDHQRLAPALGELGAEISALLESLARRPGFRLGGEPLVQFATSESLPPGEVGIAARFAADVDRPLVALAGQTSRITRQRGLSLLLPGGGRCAVTHTPFTIGRGSGNDLVLPSLAVSRNHARLLEEDGALVLEDLGSRNGIMADGVRWERLPLHPGALFRLGDVDLVVEVSG